MSVPGNRPFTRPRIGAGQAVDLPRVVLPLALAPAGVVAGVVQLDAIDPAVINEGDQSAFIIEGSMATPRSSPLPLTRAETMPAPAPPSASSPWASSCLGTRKSVAMTRMATSPNNIPRTQPATTSET